MVVRAHAMPLPSHSLLRQTRGPPDIPLPPWRACAHAAPRARERAALAAQLGDTHRSTAQAAGTRPSRPARGEGDHAHARAQARLVPPPPPPPPRRRVEIASGGWVAGSGLTLPGASAAEEPPGPLVRHKRPATRRNMKRQSRRQLG